MMERLPSSALAALAPAFPPPAAAAQQVAVEDPVISHMWTEGMENSHVEGLAQTLLDSQGPRLTASCRDGARSRN